MPIKNSDSDATAQLTILRIKRKRTEEPMDALLVQQERELRQNGKRIRKEGRTKPKENSTDALPTLFRLAETVEEHSFKNITEAQKLKERITRRIQPSSRPQTPDMSELKDQRVKQQVNANRQARYRVINRHRNKEQEATPPVVQSAAETAAIDLFQMYEAVKDEEAKKEPILFVDDDEEDPDDIVCNFIPMIKEYLTLSEENAVSGESMDEDDYVYDVYYRDDSSNKSGIGIHSANIGQLVWFDKDTEYLNDDSDSETGDQADEDSNAEDFYQNDYPDEESNEDYKDNNGFDLSSEDEEFY